LNLTRPLIVEIPDRHGSSNVGEAINQYVSEAIGVDM
ncbi:MAG: ATP synthase subunit F, partial [Bacillota bacterium]